MILRKGQHTLEYTIIIAIFAAAIIAMGPYIKRSICGYWRQTADVFGHGRIWGEGRGGPDIPEGNVCIRVDMYERTGPNCINVEYLGGTTLCYTYVAGDYCDLTNHRSLECWNVYTAAGEFNSTESSWALLTGECLDPNWKNFSCPGTKSTYYAKWQITSGPAHLSRTLHFFDLWIKPDEVCFLANTPILMSDGTTKPIEKIKIGDKIMAYDESTQEKVVDTVKHVFVHNTEEYLLVNGHLKVTREHPMFSDGKWIKVGSLKVGDKLLTVEGKEEVIAEIKTVKDNVIVYNLEVNPYNTYFADGYLVHNKPSIPSICDGSGEPDVP